MRKIGFDLDDVLLDFSNSFIPHLNKNYGGSLKREDATTFNYVEKHFGIDENNAVKLINDYFLHDDHINSKPVDGAIETVERLSREYDLVIITAKPYSIEEITTKWIKKYFGTSFSEIFFSNHYSKDGRKRKKSEICIEQKIDLFIDDSIENAADISNIGVPVLLPNAPWNQVEVLPNLVKRVYSWREIENEINNLL